MFLMMVTWEIRNKLFRTKKLLKCSTNTTIIVAMELYSSHCKCVLYRVAGITCNVNVT